MTLLAQPLLAQPLSDQLLPHASQPTAADSSLGVCASAQPRLWAVALSAAELEEVGLVDLVGRAQAVCCRGGRAGARQLEWAAMSLQERTELLACGNAEGGR